MFKNIFLRFPGHFTNHITKRMLTVAKNPQFASFAILNINNTITDKIISRL